MIIHSTDLCDLVEMSFFGGQNVLLSQGGGGNTSVKNSAGTHLWIKASGFRLSEVTHQSGWLGVSINKLNKSLKNSFLDKLSLREAHEISTKRVQEASSETSLRPSLETTFHAWLPDRLVLHTHSIWANCFSCMKGGNKLLSDTQQIAWIEYVTPGFLLGKAVAESYANQPNNSFLLENHGLITTGASPSEAICLHETLRPIAERIFGNFPDHTSITPPNREITTWANEFKHACLTMGHLVTARPPLRDYLRSKTTICPTQGALVPDDVVYGIHAVKIIPGGTGGKDWFKIHGPSPGMEVFWLTDLGFILVGPTEQAVNTMEENLLANVMLHDLIQRVGNVCHLPQKEVDYLVGMESERYRQMVALYKTT